MGSSTTPPRVPLGELPLNVRRPDELDADEEADAADVADHRAAALQPAQAGEEVRAHGGGVLRELLALDDVEHRLRARRGRSSA